MWPYLSVKPEGNSGADARLMETLAQKYGFYFALLPPTRSIDGKTLKNGSTIGLIPDVST